MNLLVARDAGERLVIDYHHHSHANVIDYHHHSHANVIAITTDVVGQETLTALCGSGRMMFVRNWVSIFLLMFLLSYGCSTSPIKKTQGVTGFIAVICKRVRITISA
jgi:hypothetical protein